MAANWAIFLLTIHATFATFPIGTSKPHIIFLCLDDVGINDVGYNNPEIHSPNIDAMANDGIILTNSYVHALCTPSRAAFMTGYEPYRTGLQQLVIANFAPIGLPLEFKLLPQHLREKGYGTYMFGKWHLGGCHESYLPHNRGFDRFFGFIAAATNHYKHTYPLTDDVTSKCNHGSQPDVIDVFDLFDQSRPALEYDGIHTLEAMLTETEKSLSTRDPSKPMFIYWASPAVHSPTPSQYPPQYEDHYQNVTNQFRKQHNAFVSYLDDAIGRLKKLLIDHNIYNNSIIICTTDNGGDTRSGGNNYPLRGGKRTSYEGGTKGVAFIHSPLLTNKRYKYDGFVHSVDYNAMIKHIAGCPPDNKTDGINVWPAIESNTASPRKEFVYDLFSDIILNLQPTGSIRDGKWKLSIGNDFLPNTRVLPNDVTGQYVNWCGADSNLNILGPILPRLYNIDDDPYECRDVSFNNPTKVLELKSKLLKIYNNDRARELFQFNNIKSYKQKTADLTVYNTNWCSPIQTA